MTADQRAVDAAMKASDCLRAQDSNGNWYCEAHWYGWLSDVDACPRAESIAAAVVAAVQGPIKAEALREAADAYLEADAATRFIVQPAKWLRDRADRIEAQP